jgi:hypothetical protein
MPTIACLNGTVAPTVATSNRSREQRGRIRHAASPAGSHPSARADGCVKGRTRGPPGSDPADAQGAVATRLDQLHGRIPQAGALQGGAGSIAVCDGCDPGAARGPARRALAGSAVASRQVGALQGGAGSIAVRAMNATPETNEASPHAPWPAPRSHPGPLLRVAPAAAPSCAAPCSAARGRPRSSSPSPDVDFAGFPSAVAGLASAGYGPPTGAND